MVNGLIFASGWLDPWAGTYRINNVFLLLSSQVCSQFHKTTHPLVNRLPIIETNVCHPTQLILIPLVINTVGYKLFKFPSAAPHQVFNMVMVCFIKFEFRLLQFSHVSLRIVRLLSKINRLIVFTQCHPSLWAYLNDFGGQSMWIIS